MDWEKPIGGGGTENLSSSPKSFIDNFWEII